ncbi:MAG: CBASS oligonucleotide cyclase [Hyphomonadaceae bacterium]
MPLTNTELSYYDSNVLRLPKEKRAEYHAQVDNLILELCGAVREKTEINITDVVKAGSFAKHTILRKTSADPVDVDVVFYISGRNVDAETLQGLNDTLYDLLIKIYPTKKVKDFELQRKAAKVTFAGTGLSVDIVPVIEDPKRVGYGWQFDLIDGSVVQTCAPCQIEFVRNRKKRDKDYRTLVRMAKRWRNHAELDALKSFPIELIVAHLLDKEGAGGSIEQRFRRFLLFIAQSELKQPIVFAENGVVTTLPAGEVVIIDPVCSSNNVTSRITAKERVEIVKAASISWETANFASAENDNEVWKEIFGPRFRTEDE